MLNAGPAFTKSLEFDNPAPPDFVYSHMRRDLVFAVRLLARHSGLALTAVLTLALGVGANAAIFSALDAVLLRPLPFSAPERLVLLEQYIEGETGPPGPIAGAEFVDYRDRTRTIEALAAFQTTQVSLADESRGAARVAQARVSASIFPLLGVSPVHGRGFTPDEDVQGRDDVAVLSHGVWQRYFGGDPAAVGRSITVDGRRRTVIGVMPRDFGFPVAGLLYAEPADLWVPFAMPRREIEDRGNVYSTAVIGRLRTGISRQEAQADVRRVAAEFAKEHPRLYTRIRVSPILTDLGSRTVGDTRRPLILVACAVVLVLLIACANLCNLMLVHAAGRRTELAVRLALGATRARVVRQFAVEGLVLAGAGTAAALAIAWAGISLIRLAPGVPRLDEASLDLRVIGVTALLAAGAAVAAMLLPAVAATRRGAALREPARGPSDHASRARPILIVFETATALVLLVAAALLANSLVRVLTVDPGFQTEGITTVRTALPALKYGSPSRRQAVTREVLERLRVQSDTDVAAATHLPLSGGWQIAFSVEGGDPGKFNIVSSTAITSGYFDTLGIALRDGRDFTEADTLDTPGVIIISESLARQFWPGQSAIGRRTQWGPLRSDRPWLTVVGVAADVRASALDTEPEPLVYMPLMQFNFPMDTSPVYIMRSARDPGALIAAARRTVTSVDSELAVYEARTMSEVVSASTARRRFSVALVGAFGVLALALAAIGLYGVMSYHVAQRTHEFGIRAALGAARTDILRGVVFQGLRLSCAGVAGGLAIAVPAGRFIEAELYGIPASDAATLAASAGVLLGVALAASYLPARRAVNVDPAVALRSDT